MSNNFKSIGNLAFYEGWSPSYFYFNTLRHTERLSDLRPSAWNPEEAKAIADRAIADAEAHMHFNGLAKDDADLVVREKF